MSFDAPRKPIPGCHSSYLSWRKIFKAPIPNRLSNILPDYHKTVRPNKNSHLVFTFSSNTGEMKNVKKYSLHFGPNTQLSKDSSHLFTANAMSVEILRYAQHSCKPCINAKHRDLPSLFQLTAACLPHE